MVVKLGKAISGEIAFIFFGGNLVVLVRLGEIWLIFVRDYA